MMNNEKNKKGFMWVPLTILVVFSMVVLGGCPGVGSDVPNEDDDDPVVATQLAEPDPSITGATEFTLTVGWAAIPNVDGYTIEKYLDDTGTVLDQTETLVAGETEYTFNGLDSNEFYYFRVQATTTDPAYSNSSYSALIEGRTLPELGDLLVGFSDDYYYYPEPLSYGAQITKWEITSPTPTTLSIERYNMLYQKTYPVEDWHYIDTLTYTITGYSFLEEPFGFEFHIDGSDTTFQWYFDYFNLKYSNGTFITYENDLDSANEPYFAYDVDDEFDNGNGNIWYCRNLTNTNYYYAFKADFVSHWDFDIRDQEYITNWNSVSETSSQHVTISSVNINANASLYYGTFEQTVNGTVYTDYITLEFFSETRADLIFYTDDTYSAIKKLGGTDIIYELHSVPSEIGATATLFL